MKLCSFRLILALIFSLVIFHSGMAIAQDGEDLPTGTDVPKITTGTEKDGGGFSMNGAMGATIINGKSYQFFSLRPDIPIWKFGVGLDLSFYFDAEGNLREEDWDEAADIIEKIYYIRYGKPGQPLFVRVGSLAPTTLGYGLIMNRYTNAIEWPQVRRIGMQTEVNAGKVKTEALLNNFREIDSPGLVAARLSYELKFGLPVVVGATIVHDGNQYLGAKDEDDDGIPDNHDMFPGKNDGSEIESIKSLSGYSEIYTRALIERGEFPDIYNPPKNITELDEPVTEMGIDVGMPLLRNKIMSIWAYAQGAQIADYGSGFTVPGVLWRMGPFRASAEYRIFQKEFESEFFGFSYEVERVTWEPDAINPNETEGDYVTKEEKLAGIPSANGFYASAGAYLFNVVDVFAAYENMMYDDDAIPNQSFYALGTLNTEYVPKIDLAQGYFRQPKADKIFSTESDGTVIGYRIGASMGKGVMLVYDNKTIYHNGEPNKIMTIETVITFK